MVERDIRIEDVLDLGEKFNDVLFMSRNTANLVEELLKCKSDILVLGEKINNSLVVSECTFLFKLKYIIYTYFKFPRFIDGSFVCDVILSPSNKGCWE